VIFIFIGTLIIIGISNYYLIPIILVFFLIVSYTYKVYLKTTLEIRRL